MFRLNTPAVLKAALVAVTLVPLAGVSASYADVAQQIAIARGSHLAVPSTARAQYFAPAPSNAGIGGKCVGGYQWTQRSFSVHRTENQMALPVRCH